MASIDTRSKAVIYPAGTVSGYGHIYSLGIAGVHVTALSTVNCINFMSRYVREKYVVPDPMADHEKFLSWLMDYGRRQETKPTLFLAEDLYAYIASLYQEQLRTLYLFPYIRPEALDAFFHKGIMFRKAAEANIRLPKTILLPMESDDLDNWSSFPAIVKPAVSRFKFEGKTLKSVCNFPTVFGGKAVFAAGPSDLMECVLRLRGSELEYCVQEYIAGDNSHLFTVYFVAAEDGSIPSFSTHYKVRQRPADFGTTSVSQSISVPQLRDYAEQFCKTTGYSGPATMEFKLSSRDSLWYLMEINPRLGFSIRRSTEKGVNMPLQQYLLSTGQQLMRVVQRDDRRFWIDIPGDIEGLLWRRSKRQWRLSFWQIVKPYFSFREAVFNFKDPLPGILRLFSSLVRGLGRRIDDIFHR